MVSLLILVSTWFSVRYVKDSLFKSNKIRYNVRCSYSPCTGFYFFFKTDIYIVQGMCKQLAYMCQKTPPINCQTETKMYHYIKYFPLFKLSFKQCFIQFSSGKKIIVQNAWFIIFIEYQVNCYLIIEFTLFLIYMKV